MPCYNEDDVAYVEHKNPSNFVRERAQDQWKKNASYCWNW